MWIPMTVMTGGRDQTPHRELYDVRLELFSEIYNTFQSPLNSEDKIKHSIRFQTDYEYIPEYNQEEYPVFDAIDQEYDQEDYPLVDGIDRIAGRNLITYSVTKHLYPPHYPKGSFFLPPVCPVEAGAGL